MTLPWILSQFHTRTHTEIYIYILYFGVGKSPNKTTVNSLGCIRHEMERNEIGNCRGVSVSGKSRGSTSDLRSESLKPSPPKKKKQKQLDSCVWTNSEVTRFVICGTGVYIYFVRDPNHSCTQFSSSWSYASRLRCMERRPLPVGLDVGRSAPLYGSTFPLGALGALSIWCIMDYKLEAYDNRHRPPTGLLGMCFSLFFSCFCKKIYISGYLGSTTKDG